MARPSPAIAVEAHLRRQICMLLFCALCILPGAAAAKSQLTISEQELVQFLDAAGAVTEWRIEWTKKLGEPKPSDDHPLDNLISSGADRTELDALLLRAGVSTLEEYVSLERRLSEIYHALYADTSALAAMAVAIELTIKGKEPEPLERARMIKYERLAIERERRARVAPQTIEIVGSHALALARAFGDIK